MGDPISNKNKHSNNSLSQNYPSGACSDSPASSEHEGLSSAHRTYNKTLLYGACCVLGYTWWLQGETSAPRNIKWMAPEQWYWGWPLVSVWTTCTHVNTHTSYLLLITSSIKYLLSTSMTIMPKSLLLQMTNQRKGRKIKKQEKTAFLSLLFQPKAQHNSQERNLSQPEIYLKITRSGFPGMKFSNLCSSSSRRLRTERATCGWVARAGSSPVHHPQHCLFPVQRL